MTDPKQAERVDLLSCPFCGAGAYLEEEEYAYFAACRSQLCVRLRPFKDRSYAAEVWNTRLSPPAGMLLVPKVATEEMLRVGDDAFCKAYGPSRGIERDSHMGPVGTANIAAVYTAMIAAALGRAGS